MRDSPVILLVEDNHMDVELAVNAFRQVSSGNDLRVAGSWLSLNEPQKGGRNGV